MTTLAASTIAAPAREPLNALQRLLSRLRGPERHPDFEDSLARRDFIQDMISRNPDAFSSDLDVQNMMGLFPDRF